MTAGGEALLVIGALVVATSALVTRQRSVARAERELARHAVRDPLTGLANRTQFHDHLTDALSVSAAGTIAVLLIDVDDFRLVNDSLGHSAGDQLLIAIASRLLDALPPGTIVARFGGDEFVVAYPGLADAAAAFDVAQQLSMVIAEPLEVRDRIVTATASIGVTTNSYVSCAEDLIREADTARFAAKRRGRGRVHQFGEILRQQVTRRFTIEHELRAALRRGEMRLHYQPIIDLATGRAVGIEALLRWRHPALGEVPPATFIPVAEETELVSTIGAFALEEACLQAAVWRDQGRPLRVSVNVSGQQISDTHFAAFVAETLTDVNLPANLLCLELTESVLMSDAMRTIDSLTALKALGTSLSVDDFGTGYSSLAYLHHFPVDELKIDRAFVHGLTDRHDQHLLLSAMVAMGKALGLRVVAEGVETPSQLRALREFGCDLAQGYLFARPQNARDLSVLLADSAAASPINVT